MFYKSMANTSRMITLLQAQITDLYSIARQLRVEPYERRFGCVRRRLGAMGWGPNRAAPTSLKQRESSCALNKIQSNTFYFATAMKLNVVLKKSKKTLKKLMKKLYQRYLPEKKII
jgi:hypothetical protein